MTENRHELAPEQEPKLLETFAGAWKEAFGSSGIERMVLIPLVAFLTVASLPFLPLFWVLEKLGMYNIESGFSLP